MDFNADNNDHGEHGNHDVGHRSHFQPVPLLLGRQYDTMEDARLSIKHQLQDSGLPYATKFANKIRFFFVCPKIRSNTTQQCDFIVRPVLEFSPAQLLLVEEVVCLCCCISSSGHILEQQFFNHSDM
jgi:hypothetical protein